MSGPHVRADLPPFQPLAVHSRGQIVDALVGRRHALGWSGEELDARAGWADRYGSKLERPNRPQGRVGFHFDWPTEVLPSGSIRAAGMADIWLEALGLRLVLLDEATAGAIGAVDAPSGPPTVRPRQGGDLTAFHAARRSSRGIAPPMAAPAYEICDRALVAKDCISASIIDHPWLAERPELKAKAEAVAHALEDLRVAVVRAAG